MIIENSQNEKLTLQDKIKNIVDSRLTYREVHNGYLSVAGLAGLLKKDERTIRRWNSLRLQGNKNIGIAFHQDIPNGPIKYFLEDVYEYFLNTRC